MYQHVYCINLSNTEEIERLFFAVSGMSKKESCGPNFLVTPTYPAPHKSGESKFARESHLTNTLLL
jgi:hypothetical protein